MVCFHSPVMVEEVIHYLRPKPGGVLVDATLGGGGHAERLADILGPSGTLIGLDVDGEAIAYAERRLSGWGGNLCVRQTSFRNLAEVLAELGTGLVDGVLFDLGVSQHQLSRPERGFSYQRPGPLDMRMSQGRGATAYRAINHQLTRKQLADIIARYGEERWADRIASFIAEARERGPIETTDQLVAIIKDAIPASARRAGPHPARRTFQALRIFINDELGALNEALDQAVSWLADGGRMVFITYHSLEDRIVKDKFRDLEGRCVCPPGLPVCACGQESWGKIVTRKPVFPDRSEVEVNPRSRSARLRCFERREVIAD